MRLASGTTDQYVYFVAVDATDLKSREQSLSSFTVYRSRNGAAAAAMTTPTVNETDTTNMPGVYELLLDEDTTIAAGNSTEELVLHITHAGMAPVTRVIELYRPTVTEGNTLGVASDGDISGNLDGTVATVTTLTGHTAQTGDSFARIGVAGAGLTDLGGMSTGMKAEVNAEADTALSDIGLQYVVNTALPTNWATDVTANSALDYMADDGTAVYDRTTDSLQAIADSGGGGPTAAQIADAVWDEPTVGHTTASTFGAQCATDIDAILVDTAEIGAAGVGLTEAGGTGDQLTAVAWNAAWDAEVQSEVTDALNAYDPPTNAEMNARTVTSATYATAAALATVDGNVDAILVDTGTTLPATLATLSTAAALATVDGNVDAILVDTGTTLPATLATLSTAAALATVDGNVDAILADTGTDGVVIAAGQTVATVTDVTNEVSADVTKISGSGPAADNLEASALGIIPGATAGTPSVTASDTNLTGYANDELIGRVIVFTGGTAAGQASDITDYANTNGVVTYTAITTAPAASDTFVIV